jgi:hypothetical protein
MVQQLKDRMIFHPWQCLSGMPRLAVTWEDPGRRPGPTHHLSIENNGMFEKRNLAISTWIHFILNLSLYIYIYWSLLINFHHQHIKIYQIIIYMMLPNWMRPQKILASYPYCCLNHLYHLQFCCLTHPIFGGVPSWTGPQWVPQVLWLLSKLQWTGSKFTMCLDKS